TSTGFSFDISIPTVEAVDSSMDEAALRDVLSGGFMKHVAEVAALDATRITIPEVTVTSTSTTYGVTQTTKSVLRNIVLDNVTDGIATRVSVDGLDVTATDGRVTLGSFSANAVDFNSILGMYGLTAGGDAGAPLKTYYKDVQIEGGSFSGNGVTCSIGSMSTGELKGRAIAVAYKDYMEAAVKLGESTGGEPPAEAIRTVVAYLMDLFEAFEGSPFAINGFDCSGKDPAGSAFAFGIGKFSFEGYTPGFYPAMRLEDLNIAADDGQVSVGAIDWKVTDLHKPFAVLKANMDKLDSQWFENNWRLVVPDWQGLAITDVNVDVPSTDVPGGRVKGSLASFDLTLGDYVNGIPSTISSSAKNLVVPFPENSTDPQVVMLLSLGIKQLDLGYDIAAKWDAQAKTIRIDKIGIEGSELGSLAVAATIGNAAEQIFALNTETMMAALMGVTVKDLKIDVADSGLGNIGWPILAGQEGVDPTTFRDKMAATAEGFSIALLGSTDTARQLGQSIGNFIKGTAGSVSISIVAKDPNGLAIPLLMQASQDPSILGSQVTVTGGQ
ncbi:MAG: hypothetical protein ABL879_08355, partial [Devosia sp.]